MARVLVDMDSTIADWGKEFDRMLDERGEVAANIPRQGDQREWSLDANRTEDEVKIIAEIMNDPGFYARLEIMPHAKEQLLGMVERGHEVILVTSPWLTNPTCISDKFQWVAEHLGADWAERVIITKDKTHVSGDILIDDKPEIKGTGTPKWRHILFDQPYNQYITDKARVYNWLDFIAEEWVYPVGAEPATSLGESYGVLGRGEVRTTSATGGQKGVKPQRYDLIPIDPLNLLAELYGNGAAKYAAHNWRKGYEWSNSYAAAQRHMTAFWNGEDMDPEMGLPHVTSAAFHMFALAQFMQDFPEFDDRFKA